MSDYRKYNQKKAKGKKWLLVIFNLQQECIPAVGYVPSAAVAICAQGGVYPRGVCLGGCVCQIPPPPPVDRMRDRCKNITLPELCCGR